MTCYRFLSKTLPLLMLLILASCGGGGTSSEPPTPIGSAPTSNPTPLVTPSPSPTAIPIPESTPVPTPTPSVVLQPIGSDTFNGEPISKIIADGFGGHPFWDSYWLYNIEYGRFFNSQYEIDKSWEDLGFIAFDPQPGACVSSYVSPFNREMPLITLVGDRVIDLAPGSDFVDPGFSATSINGDDITANVVVTGALDTNTEGNYLLTYHLSDEDNNVIASESRLIRIFSVEPRIESLVLKENSISPMNHYAFVPKTYGTPEQENYPVIIHFHGWSGSEDFGPPEERLGGGVAEAARQIGTSLGIEGTQFLVFQPQRSQVLRDDIFTASVSDPTLRDPCEIREFIDYVLLNYDVDPTRIYFVGFSNGVAAVLEYLRSFNDRAAATLLLAGGGWLQPMCDFKHIPHWGLVGGNDGDSQEDRPILWRNINEQRLCPDGTQPMSKFTVIPGLGHTSVPILNNSLIGVDDPRFEPFDMSVYEWLLQFQNENIDLYTSN